MTSLIHLRGLRTYLVNFRRVLRSNSPTVHNLKFTTSFGVNLQNSATFGILNRSTNSVQIWGLKPLPNMIFTWCCFSSGTSLVANRYRQISPMYWVAYNWNISSRYYILACFSKNIKVFRLQATLQGIIY